MREETKSGSHRRPVTLSLVMIVKNEESVLARSLDSVKDIVDEMVIVDTGSTDRTKEIAASYAGKLSRRRPSDPDAAADDDDGVKVIDFEWCDDFAAARNFGLAAATSDWILHLDADEELGAGAELLPELLRNKYLWAYVIRIVVAPDNAAVSENKASAASAIRLFRRRQDLHYAYAIHEMVHVDDPQRYAACSVTVVHFGPTLDDEVEMGARSDRNLRILHSAIDRNPEDAYLLYYVGAELLLVGDHEAAFAAYSKSLKFTQNQMIAYVPPMIRDMAYCLVELGHTERALTLLADAEDRYPSYTDLFLLEGEIHANHGDVLKAQALFRRCMGMGEPVEYSSWGGTSTWRPEGHLAQLEIGAATGASGG